MMFINWDGRPALSFSPSQAIAILKPGGEWVSVNVADVWHTGRVIPDEALFRSQFSSRFGDFEIPTKLKDHR